MQLDKLLGEISHIEKSVRAMHVVPEASDFKMSFTASVQLGDSHLPQNQTINTRVSEPSMFNELTSIINQSQSMNFEENDPAPMYVFPVPETKT